MAKAKYKPFLRSNAYDILGGGAGKWGAELLGGFLSGTVGAKPLPDAAIRFAIRELAAVGYSALGMQFPKNAEQLNNVALVTAGGWNEELSDVVLAWLSGQELW